MIDLDQLKKEEESIKTIKNDLEQDTNYIINGLTDVKQWINSSELNQKLNEFEENYRKESIELLKSLDNITLFMENQLGKYVRINETTRVDLSDLIDALNSIENPLKEMIKKDDFNE